MERLLSKLMTARDFLAAGVIMAVLSFVWPAALCAGQGPGILNKTTLIAHAMGQIGENSYTNSLEAFTTNYAKGKRVFEVDLTLTNGNDVVCCHDNQEKAYGLDKNIHQITRQEFLARRIYGKYTPLDLAGLLSLMLKYKDIYIVTDTKDDFTTIFERIYKSSMSRDPKLLDRIIPQVYGEKDINDLSRYYRFKNIIFTLYRSKMTDDEVVLFVKKNHINAVTMSVNRFTPELVRKLSDHGVPAFVHTVNDPEQVKKFRAQGVHGFYTDSYAD